MKALILLCSLLLLSTCKARPGTSALLAKQEKTKAVFKENTTYSTIIAHRNIGGKMSLVRKGDKYNFKVSMLFMGAGLFSRTTPEEAQKSGGLENLPPKEYFGTGQYSFENIPSLKNRILQLTKQIEGYFATEFSSLSIEASFADDRKWMGDATISDNHNVYLTQLNQAAEKYTEKTVHTDKAIVSIPIIMLAIPNPMVATPTAWDPYSAPVLLAHETAHLLGIITEGFLLDAYPPHGLMNDEISFTLLKEMAPKVHISLQKTDFDEIFVDPQWGSSRHNWDPAVDNNAIIQSFTPTNTIYTDANNSEKFPSRADYTSITQEERINIVRKTIEYWIKTNGF